MINAKIKVELPSVKGQWEWKGGGERKEWINIKVECEEITGDILC